MGANITRCKVTRHRVFSGRNIHHGNAVDDDAKDKEVLVPAIYGVKTQKSLFARASGKITEITVLNHGSRQLNPDV